VPSVGCHKLAILDLKVWYFRALPKGLLKYENTIVQIFLRKVCW